MPLCLCGEQHPRRQPRRLFNLVIFDCDGVLVDSELISNRVFRDMLVQLGATVTLDDMFERFVGRSMADCLVVARELIGRDLPPGFAEDYRRRTGVALAAELRPVAGIEQALDALTLPYCVASSGDQHKMRTTLGLTGLLERFEGRLFSVTEVARGKPAPDIFLHAAARMGVAPERTAVVEDTPVGVAAGKAAGMSVFGFAERTPAARLREAGASVVFESMSELPGLLGVTHPAS
jgi:HAD superfamily hydrolase (TIGR01509 family)